jgi:hypothetical protein
MDRPTRLASLANNRQLAIASQYKNRIKQAENENMLAADYLNDQCNPFITKIKGKINTAIHEYNKTVNRIKDKYKNKIKNIHIYNNDNDRCQIDKFLLPLPLLPEESVSVELTSPLSSNFTSSIRPLTPIKEEGEEEGGGRRRTKNYRKTTRLKTTRRRTTRRKMKKNKSRRK